MAERSIVKSPAVVGLSGWLVPGLGYWLIGERARGVTIGVTILSIMTMGVLIGGIRIFDVPGYDKLGDVIGQVNAKLEVDPKVQWHPLNDVLNKPWYMGQILAGPVTIGLSAASLKAAEPVDRQVRIEGVSRSHSRSWEIGVLYTAVAGMLNLLAIIDSSHRAMGGEPSK